MFLVFVSASNYIILAETNTKICLIAETKNGKYFYLRKQNQRFCLQVMMSKIKDFVLLGKTKTHSLLLGKSITDFFSLAETNQMIFSCLGKQKNIFFFLGKQNQIFFHLRNQTKGLILLGKQNHIFFAWDNKKYIYYIAVICPK